MRTKKALSILLVLTMICSLFISAVPVTADGPYYEYKIKVVDADGNNVEGVTFSQTIYSYTDGIYSFQGTAATMDIDITGVPTGYKAPSVTSIGLSWNIGAVNAADNSALPADEFSYESSTLTVTLEKDEPAVHTNHPVCGATCIGDHDGEYGDNNGHSENIEYTALTQDIVDGWGTDGDKKIMPAGNYYLAQNISIDGFGEVSLPAGEVNLCLNGYKFAVNYDTYDNGAIAFVATDDVGSTFSVSDCQGTGEIYGGSQAAFIGENNSMYLYSGNLTANSYHTLDFRGNLYMYDGCVKKPVEEYGNPVSAGYQSTFYMYGGTIEDGAGFASLSIAHDTAKVYIYSGEIAGKIEVYGPLYIEGDPDIAGEIELNGYPININGPLTYTTPLKINTKNNSDPTADFTVGWGTYMSDKTPEDYFVAAVEGSGLNVNAETVELYLGYPYSVTVSEVVGGSITVSRTGAYYDDYIGLTATPSEGYTLKEFIVKNAAGEAVEVWDEDGEIFFWMPESDATVSAVFKKDEPIGAVASVMGSETNEAVTGAKIALYSADDSEVSSWVSDGSTKDFTSEITDTAATYTLKIVEIPEGYIMPDVTEFDFVLGEAKKEGVFHYDGENIVITMAQPVRNTYTFYSATTIAQDGEEPVTTYVPGVNLKLTEADGTAVDGGEWTTTANAEESTKSFDLDPEKEYTFSVTADIDGYVKHENYSITFPADGELDSFYDSCGLINGFAITPTDGIGEPYIIDHHLAELDEGIPTLGEGAQGANVKINFVDREGAPVVTTGDYLVDSTVDDSAAVRLGRFTGSSLELTGLADGSYAIETMDAAVNASAGYVFGSGAVYFEIKDGALVTVDNDESEIYAPHGTGPTVKEGTVTENGFTVELGSYKVGFYVTVPGIDYDIDYKVTAQGSEDILASPETSDSSIYLAPGTYTLAAVAPTDDEEAKNYIDFENNSSVDFVIGNDYSVTIADGQTADAKIEDYGTDDKEILLRLAPKTIKTITAAINAAENQTFNEYTQVWIETASGNIIYSETLPVGDTTATYTWTVPAYEYVTTPESSWEEYQWQEVTGYVVKGDWTDDESPDYYPITFTTTDGTTYTATVDYNDKTVAEVTYPVTISADLAHGKITADVTEAKEGDTVTLTVTPDDGYKLTEGSLAVTDEYGDTVEVTQSPARAAVSTYSFAMPASTVDVTAAFELDTIFTVAADASKTTDVDTAVDGVQVYAGDTVTVEVIVKGGAFTNADWTLLYDSSKFALADGGVQLHESATEVQTNNESELAGQILGAHAATSGNEYAEDTVVATYTFTAKAQDIDGAEGKFAITSAHTNNYTMAGDLNNCPAHTQADAVAILQVTDTEGGDTGEKPSGSIGDTTANYSGLAQAGEAYTLNADYADATVTYAANADGTQAADPSTLTYRTARPTWTEVGTYYYYVKVSGDGLAVIYDEATLTIQPRPVEPTVEFAVDPEVGVNAVTITPVITNVVDNSFKGTVTVTGGEGDDAFTETFEASTFTYDGESSAYGAPFTVNAPTSGEFVVNITYTANTTGDNYADGRGTASVEVDKITAEDTTVDELKSKITNEFIYNAEAHSVTVDEASLPTGWELGGITDAFTDGAAPTVTNVGEEVLAKVVFEDTTGGYNDVVVYVVLSVTPAKVTVTIGDFTKAMGEDDPTDFSVGMTMAVELADGTTQPALFGDDDLQLDYTRAEGEIPGDYAIDASYVPDNNYEVEIVPGTLTITAFSISDDPGADILVEVVDNSPIAEDRPDYIAGKRLILVYTNVDKAYFAYGDETNGYAKMYDVTGAGYKYVDNQYADGTLTPVTDTTNTYAHVYGIIVDAIGEYAPTEEHEAQYVGKVKYMGNDAAYKPERIIYDADINMSETEVDVNDYSMTVGIYNVLDEYDITTNTREDMDNALKADYTKDKLVDSSDALGVKGVAVR